MGACEFVTTARGDTPAEAYRNAVRQAHYDHGHDGYNGTISTTSGYFLVERMEEQEPWDCMARADAGGATKRGKCLAMEWEPGVYVFAGWAAS